MADETSIKLSLDLKAGDVRKSAQELADQLRKIFESGAGNTTDAKLQKILATMSKLGAKSAELQNQLSDYATEIPTAEYAKIQLALKQVEKQKAELARLTEETIGSLQAKGYSEQDIYNDAAMKEANQQWLELEQRANNYQAQLKQLELTGQAVELVPRSGETAEKVNQISASLNDVNNQLQIQKTLYEQAGGSLEMLRQQAQSVGDENGIKQISNDAETARTGIGGLIDRFMAFMRILGGTTSEMQRSSEATQQQTEKTEQLAESQKRVEASAKGASKSVRQMSTRKTIDGLDGLKDAFDRVRHGSNQFERGLKRGIRTFIKYAFGVRSIFFLYRKLRAAVMEGFKNLQEYSDPLKQSIQSLKDSLGQLKNQFAASFSPIVTAVLPYIQTFINALNAAISKVGQFIAALAGRKTWTRAKLVSTAVSDGMNNAAGATGSANDAAKEYKKTLMGFDDVNILQEPDKGSGSGGGAGAGGINQVNPEDMFEEVGIDSGIMGIADALREMAEAGDWYGIGQTIADKLKETLESIKWDEVYEKAANFGKNLASFLNGLIDPELFYDVGATVAGALNTAIIFALELGKEFDADNFGNALAQAINGFFQKFDFKKLGQTIGTWVKNFTDTIRSFLLNIDWKSVFSAIGDFFEGLGIDGIMNILGLVAMKKFFSNLKTLFKTKINGAITEGAKEGAPSKINLGTIGGAVTIALSILWLISQYGNDAVDEISADVFNKILGDQFGKIRKEDMTVIRKELGISLNFTDLKEQILRFADGEGWYTEAQQLAQNAAKRLGLLNAASFFGPEVTGYFLERAMSLAEGMKTAVIDPILELFSTIKFFGVDWDGIKAKSDEFFNGLKENHDEIIQYYTDGAAKEFPELAEQVAQEMLDSGYEMSDEMKAMISSNWSWQQKEAIKNAQKIGNDTPKNLLRPLVAGLNAGKGQIEDVFDNYTDRAVGSMMGAGKYGSWQGLGSKIVNNIADGHLRAQAIAAGGITRIVETEAGILYQFADGTWSYGQNIVKGIAKGMNDSTSNSAIENATRLTTNNIKNHTKAMLEIASPSKWMEREIGNNITLGIANGITGKQNSAINAISGIGTKLQNTLKNQNLYNVFKNMGINLMQGLIDGISAKDAIATQKIANSMTNVKNRGKNVLGIASPSKVFREIGEFTIQGFALGIEDEEQKAVNAMEQVSAAIARAGAASMPAVVRGAVVPHTALSGTASTAATAANKPITRDELETVLSRVVAKYMNIDFYIGDEQIARHADAGKQMIGKKYNPVLA